MFLESNKICLSIYTSNTSFCEDYCELCYYVGNIANFVRHMTVNICWLS